MKRTELEKHIDEQVEVVLFDKTVLTGVIRKGNSFFNQLKIYHIVDENKHQSCAFRCSHVIKLTALKGLKEME